jgi:hypothetical protein
MASYGTSDQLPPRPSNNIDVERQNEPDFPVARSVDHLLVTNRSLSNLTRNESAGVIRRPYIFNHRSRATSTNSVNSEGTSTNADLNRDHHNMAIRYRLFNRLDPGGTNLGLVMPDHVFLQSELFSILPFDDFKDEHGKQSSIVTIFSIWNTMMGTSLLAMPWAIQQSGLGLGVFLMIFMAFVAAYTAYRVVESPRNLGRFFAFIDLYHYSA